MIVYLSETIDLCTAYESQPIICRCNAFWPKPMDLFHWIFIIWTINCEIHLHSKSFFIVKFASLEEGEYIPWEGPWFCGTFCHPMVPIFRCQYNGGIKAIDLGYKLHHPPTFLAPSSARRHWGPLREVHKDRHTKSQKTNLHFCQNLCGGGSQQRFANRIFLTHNKQCWTQFLYFENMTFRCRIWWQTKHL